MRNFKRYTTLPRRHLMLRLRNEVANRGNDIQCFAAWIVNRFWKLVVSPRERFGNINLSGLVREIYESQIYIRAHAPSALQRARPIRSAAYMHILHYADRRRERPYWNAALAELWMSAKPVSRGWWARKKGASPSLTGHTRREIPTRARGARVDQDRSRVDTSRWSNKSREWHF